MKGCVTVLLSLLVYGGHSWPWGSSPSCPEAVPPKCTAVGSYLPHPSDCHYFVQCDAAKQPICKECAPGTNWNSALAICDFAQNVKCEQKTKPTVTTKPVTILPPVTTTTRFITIPSELPECPFVPPARPCPSGSSSNAPSVFRDYPQNSRCYYQCINGTPFLTRCPAALQFNATTNICE